MLMHTTTWARLGPWTARGVPPYGRTVGTARGRHTAVAHRLTPLPHRLPTARRAEQSASKHHHQIVPMAKQSPNREEPPAGAIQSDTPSLTPEEHPKGEAIQSDGPSATPQRSDSGRSRHAPKTSHTRPAESLERVPKTSRAHLSILGMTLRP